jgi:deoxyribodipyrimidine photo-lyase
LSPLDDLKADPRVTVRCNGAPDAEGQCVVYWMQRAQRGMDNPALNTAIKAANELQKPLAVFFGLHPHYPDANLRHYAFLVEGLRETADTIEKRGAAFVFRPYPQHDLIRFCQEVKACLVIGDENPLREPQRWRQRAAEKLRLPFWTVDADVVVPVKLFEKEEYAARTIRPKIHRLLEVFLQPLDSPRAHFPFKTRPESQPIGWSRPEWVYGRGVGDWRQTRPSLGASPPGVRHDSLHVRRGDGAQIQYEGI